MHIVVLYSTPTKRSCKSKYKEADEDTADSAEEVRLALISRGCDVECLALTEHSIEKEIQSINADLVFNLIEWTGEDLPLSMRAMDALEHSGIPFTGATKENFLVTTDKALMKQTLDQLHVPTAPWQLFRTGKETFDTPLKFPVIVKLSQEHCSIGLDHLSVVHNTDELYNRIGQRLAHFHQPVFAEEFIDGREFQITAYEKDGIPVVLPPCEIPYKVGGTDAFLTYASRWIETHPDFHTSTVARAQVSPEILQKMNELTAEVFTKMHFRDYFRLDLRMKHDGTLVVLEANSNPGLTDEDLSAMTVSYRAEGMTFADFVRAIVVSAKRRFLLPDR